MKQVPGGELDRYHSMHKAYAFFFSMPSQMTLQLPGRSIGLGRKNPLSMYTRSISCSSISENKRKDEVEEVHSADVRTGEGAADAGEEGARAEEDALPAASLSKIEST